MHEHVSYESTIEIAMLGFLVRMTYLKGRIYNKFNTSLSFWIRILVKQI
jgi:hypothetical protein